MDDAACIVCFALNKPRVNNHKQRPVVVLVTGKEEHCFRKQSDVSLFESLVVLLLSHCLDVITEKVGIECEYRLKSASQSTICQCKCLLKNQQYNY